MRKKCVVVLGILALCLAGNAAWAQYDMRKSTNPYSGMGRTGWALEDHAQKVQEKKAAQQGKQNTTNKNTQIQIQQPNSQKQPANTKR